MFIVISLTYTGAQTKRNYTELTLSIPVFDPLRDTVPTELN